MDLIGHDIDLGYSGDGMTVDDILREFSSSYSSTSYIPEDDSPALSRRERREAAEAAAARPAKSRKERTAPPRPPKKREAPVEDDGDDGDDAEYEYEPALSEKLREGALDKLQKVKGSSLGRRLSSRRSAEYDVDAQKDELPQPESEPTQRFSAVPEKSPEPDAQADAPAAAPYVRRPDWWNNGSMAPSVPVEEKKEISYGGRRIDLSADADYAPTVQRIEPLTVNDDEEEAPAARPRWKKPLEWKPAPKEEDGSIFERAFRDVELGKTAYAKDDDYEDAPDEELSDDEDDEYYPKSFKEYVFTVFASIAMRLHRLNTNFDTFEDNAEELGPEVSADKASRYYGSHINSLLLRTKICAVILVVMTYFSLRLPLPGMLRDARVAGLMCFAMMLAVMLLALDVVTVGVMSMVRRHPGAEALAVLSCLVSGLDAVILARTGTYDGMMPLCAVSALSLTGALWSSLLSCQGLRKSLRVLAIGKRVYSVTGETSLNANDVTLIKSLRPTSGFVRRSEEAAPDETAFRTFTPFAVILSVLLSVIAVLVTKQYKNCVHIFSVIFSLSVPFSALLSFALPYYLTSVQIFASGCAIAGWSGLNDVGRSKNIIITDSDIFPDSAVEFESIRIFADSAPEKIIAYAGSMIAATGSDLCACFAELMERNDCAMKRIDNFEYLAGGGMKGMIDGHDVLCGGMELMRLMKVKLPFRLVNKSSVLLAVDGLLYGIFNIKYTAVPGVRAALQELMRSNRHPIFAIRDFNVTPEMIRRSFDVATDGYDFPPYVKRFALSKAEPSADSKIAAIVCKEGLGPVVKTADSGRRLYVTVRTGVLLSLLGAVIGMITVFAKLLGGADAVGAGYGIVYMLLWFLPTAVLSFVNTTKR